jgi:hypothetical protein
MLFTYTAAVFAALQALTLAQSIELSGKVGPLTSIEDKKAVKTCDITDYGGKTNSDISSAINDAFAACKNGGVVVIPSGNYNLENWVLLKNGKAWAIQLDGIITRTGTEEGNMIFIEHTSDFELFSTTSKGAIQGHGFEFHKDGSLDGPRLLRLYDVTYVVASSASARPKKLECQRNTYVLFTDASLSVIFPSMILPWSTRRPSTLPLILARMARSTIWPFVVALTVVWMVFLCGRRTCGFMMLW